MAPVSLLSSSKSSDSLIQVQLHPLVILTISDYITRHTLRQQAGPIVGAIIGAQNGREITMEHAFECKMVPKSDDTVIDGAWFQARLQQYKDVHKAAALDLVGWFTLTPPTGPNECVLPIHTHLLQEYNESALLLAFHPQSVVSATSSSGKLPLTIYESILENTSPSGTENDSDDKHMQNSSDVTSQPVLRFKEVPYTIETGEAEMIAVDFVARGGGNASAPQATSSTSSASANGTTVGPASTTSKEKAKSKVAQTNGDGSAQPMLSAADEDLIATLTTKANAVRMLRQRLALLRTYLVSIPSDSYLKVSRSEDPSIPRPNMAPDITVSHAILRSIASLLAHLPLLLPSLGAITSSALAQEAAAERTDVAMTGLLGSMGSTLRVAQGLGQKMGVVENTRNLKNKGPGGGFPALLDNVMDIDRGPDDNLGGGGGGPGGGAPSSGFGGFGGSSGGGFGGFGGVSGGGNSSSRPPVDIGALLAGQGRRT